ncbi:hypothetical protein KP509_1Z049200 [Ceratopteris richardii]|nr:hypothetical protein KP509_1Z049200 [Ceratopteris richardii]
MCSVNVKKKPEDEHLTVAPEDKDGCFSASVPQLPPSERRYIGLPYRALKLYPSASTSSFRKAIYRTALSSIEAVSMVEPPGTSCLKVCSLWRIHPLRSRAATLCGSKESGKVFHFQWRVQSTIRVLAQRLADHT